MTALRFQTGDRHQTNMASLRSWTLRFCSSVSTKFRAPFSQALRCGSGKLRHLIVNADSSANRYEPKLSAEAEQKTKGAF